MWSLTETRQRQNYAVSGRRGVFSQRFKGGPEREEKEKRKEKKGKWKERRETQK